MAPLALSTFVIVALQDSRKVFSFLLTTDCVSLDFFQGVGRGWPFLSFWPIIFLFPPGSDSRYFYLLFLAGFFFFGGGGLVPWMLVDIRLVYVYIYIYIWGDSVCVLIYLSLILFLHFCLYLPMHLHMSIYLYLSFLVLFCPINFLQY